MTASGSPGEGWYLEIYNEITDKYVDLLFKSQYRKQFVLRSQLYFPVSVPTGLLDFSGTSRSRHCELEGVLWRKIHLKKLIGLLDRSVGLLCGLKKTLAWKKKLSLIGTSAL